MLYPINEILHTIQAEGYFSGTPALFIRMQGCPVGCSWCDTKYSWQLDPKLQRPINDIAIKSKQSAYWCSITVNTLVELIKQSNYTAKHVVITGGEPCIHDLVPLTSTLEKIGYTCQIETSGTHLVNCSVSSWVTVSPKVGMRGRLPLEPQALQRADEIKHPVARARDITTLQTILQQIPADKTRIVALQPISQSKFATKLCINACLANNWRLSIQMHKYLGIV